MPATAIDFRSVANIFAIKRLAYHTFRLKQNKFRTGSVVVGSVLNKISDAIVAKKLYESEYAVVKTTHIYRCLKRKPFNVVAASVWKNIHSRIIRVISYGRDVDHPTDLWPDNKSSEHPPVSIPHYHSYALRESLSLLRVDPLDHITRFVLQDVVGSHLSCILDRY